MKKRENETETYKPINKTLIFVLFEAALIGRDAPQLIMETLTRNLHTFWNGQCSCIYLSFTFFLIIEIVYGLNIFQNI